MSDNLENQVGKAIQIGKLLPETKHKVKHYSSVVNAEKELLDLIDEKLKAGVEDKMEAARLKIEAINLRNSLHNKTKILEEYTARKKEYEAFINEMTVECNENFDSTLEEARNLPGGNMRLISAIQDWDKAAPEDNKTRIEFYLFLKQEIANFDKKKKGKK